MIIRAKYLWILLAVQVFLLIGYLHGTFHPFTSEWKRLESQEWVGDEASYFIFPFDSIRSMLDNYRSIGLPLLLRIYDLFFDGYQLWPHFQFGIYIASVFFLFWALLQFGFDRILSFVVVSLLLWNIDFHRRYDNYLIWFQFYRNLSYLHTEIPAVAFLHVSLGTMLVAVKYTRWVWYLLFACFLFFLYQIRPNMSYIALLAPLWALAFLHLKQSSHAFSLYKQTVWRVVLASWVPLFLFGFLRLVMVGQFGFATMTGGTLVGHAVHYLDENNVTKLQGESRVIGEEILRRKRQFSFPCNRSPFFQPVIPDQPIEETEARCFGPNLEIAWHVAIKHQTGKEPLSDPEKNIEPWLHISSLAPFHMRYYRTSTDNILMKFAKDVLPHTWKQYVYWVVFGGLYGIKFIFRENGMNGVYVVCFFLILIAQYMVRRALWRKQLLTLSFVALSNFFVGYVLLLLFNYPFDRMFTTLTPYMFPVFFAWAIPPVWVRKE